jgi:hypothetical protein
VQTKSDPLDHYANLPFSHHHHHHHYSNHHAYHDNHPPQLVSRESTDCLSAYAKSVTVAAAASLYSAHHPSLLSSSGSGGGVCLNESHNSLNDSRLCCSHNSKSKSNERLSIFSKSHPDLSKLDEQMLDDSFDSHPSSSSSSTHAHSRPLLHHRLDAPSSQQQLYMNAMQLEGQKFSPLDMIKAENTFLKSELEACLKKVSKLQKFEQEIQKVHQMYEDLMQSSEKKEKLERAVRFKLEIEIKRLQQLNGGLKKQMNVAWLSATNQSGGGGGMSDSANEAVKEELQKTDMLIGQLLGQNKELANVKERQDIELQAQRLTLEEQRKHIEILDSALMNAQNNVIALEANLRKKMAYEERASHLQKALANLQLASERRLQMEKRTRNQLEQEIEMLKSGGNSKHANGSAMSGNSNSLGSEMELESIKKLLRDYEEKIISLEGEVSKWEQKYLEENTMRQIEVNAASVPKDAKIAALEKTSQQTERLIAEARSERLKHMDELHEASKRTAELEAKSKDLESKLAEKDAMIKVSDLPSNRHTTLISQFSLHEWIRFFSNTQWTETRYCNSRSLHNDPRLVVTHARSARWDW